MKFIPILFSTPMILAILEDRKAMTRRVANVPNHDHLGSNIMDWGLSKHPHLYEGKWKYRVQTEVDDSIAFELKPKYGKPGDILWVRETHYAFGCWNMTGDRTKSGKDEWEFIDKTIENGAEYHFEVNDDLSKISIHTIRDGEDRWYKRPSIFMPKEACRIFLKVTDVKVERLQDISSEDAVKEGIACVSKDGIKYKFGIPDADGYPGSGEIGWKWQDWQNTPTEAFEHLWVKINGKESWEANPWVWCISFERIEKPAGFTDYPPTVEPQARNSQPIQKVQEM